MPQVKALYARLDAAVFYCSTKKASFGLHAYVAHVSAMQQTTRSIWGDLEADDREAELRELVVDHFLESKGATAERHFLVSLPKPLGTRGEVMAAGSRDEAKQRFVEDREVTLQRALRRAKADLKRAEANLQAFLEQAPAVQADGLTAASRAAGPRASDAVPQASRKRSRKKPAEEAEYEDDEDDEDDEDEGRDESNSPSMQRDPTRVKRQAFITATRTDVRGMDDGSMDSDG